MIKAVSLLSISEGVPASLSVERREDLREDSLPGKASLGADVARLG